jgi:RNA polymerase sigma-70 factor (ECF subfamily)
MDDDGFELAACLKGVKRRDEQAARQLVERLYPLVIKIVRAHGSSRLAEEDLAQEIFLKVFSRLEQYRGEGAFEHWVARVAVGTCLNALRWQKARPELRWADLTDDEAQALTAGLEGDEIPADRAVAARDLVEKLLECLSPPDRMIVRLLDLEERSVEEVSRLTGWGKSRIKVRAFRARLKLKQQLRKLQKNGMP